MKLKERLEHDRETVSLNEDKGCVVFCELKELRLQLDDLDKALALFRQECGGDPGALGIANHKGNEAIIGLAESRGLRVLQPQGMLAFEVWMYREPPQDRKPKEDEEGNGF